MGNQMFIYATARTLLEKRKDPDGIVIDDTELYASGISNYIEMCRLPNVKIVHSHEMLQKQNLSSARHCLTFYNLFIRTKNCVRKARLEHIFANFFMRNGYLACENGYISSEKLTGENVVLDGYFQSELYFRSLADQIKAELNPVNFVDNNKIGVINQLDSVCVHVRRTDYIGSNYDVCSLEYYQMAMEKMRTIRPMSKFYVFSDDIQWARENFDGDNITFMDRHRDYEDLYIMSTCNHFIICNSSFSWWAQYFGNYSQKIVIAPSKWMNSDMPMNIYLPTWKLIEV